MSPFVFVAIVAIVARSLRERSPAVLDEAEPSPARRTPRAGGGAP